MSMGKILGKDNEELFFQINKLFLERKVCDIVLIAGNDGTRIPAHRLVLSSASDYFMEVLDSGQTMSEITLEDVDGDILQILLNFIYSLSLEVCGDTVDRIMRTATQLKVKAVVTQCSEFIAARLCNAICLGVAVFSDQQNYPCLREKALIFASKHFMELIKEEPFLQLKAEHVCMLIRRNDLCVKSEEDVFQGVSIWLQHDRVNREKFSYKLLSHLRFPLLKPEFVAREVEKICHSPEIQTLIIKAFKWHLSPTSRSIFPPELSEPRNEIRKIIFISKGSKEETTVIAEEYDPLVGVWSQLELPSKPQPGWYSKGLFAVGKVYLAGTTIQGATKSSCVDCLDWTTKQLTELPPMTESRYSFGMAAINGVLYAVGGTHCENNLLIVEKWDPSSPQKWQEVAPMGTERSQPGVAVLHGLLYAIGCNSDFASNTFEFYDPQTNTWAELTPPSQARTGVCLVAVSRHLYAVGGSTKDGISNMVERYDLKTDLWIEIIPSNKTYHYQECAVSQNRLMVLIDEIQGCPSNAFEEYDPETEQWTNFKTLKRSYGPITLISN